jgi:hypothetical protein
MALETGDYISDLVITNPTGADAKSTADDHLRLVKKILTQSFPAVSGACTATHTELNFVDGVTSAIQTQIDAKAPIASPTFTGTPLTTTPTTGDSSTKINSLGGCGGIGNVTNGYSWRSLCPDKRSRYDCDAARFARFW